MNEGLKHFNHLQLFTFDVGEILTDHQDFSNFQAKLSQVLGKADPSPFVQAVTAFQFARLFARDPDLVGRLDELEGRLELISQYYHSRIQMLKRELE
ncbi:MAG: hypothetical protein CL677_07105 [Bdellovibrionaceae bacterium]|nr:hypothetical protein [Pseudobdellovibrionaceae bacterium]|tara:strand:- start:22091 stop:22381 length:291 start_codon:yes stop_codon:yes gene_type:complete